MMKLQIRIVLYSIALFISGKSFAQTTPTLNACPETFEGSVFPPPGWTVWENGEAVSTTTNNWESTSNPTFVIAGSKSAFMDRQNTYPATYTEESLTTPEFIVPVNGEIRYKTKRQISVNPIDFEVRITLMSDESVNLLKWNNSNHDEFISESEKHVDLSSYTGQLVKISFVIIQDQSINTFFGPRIALDDVRVVSKCPEITNIAVVEMENLADITWDDNGSSQYEIMILPSDRDASDGIAPTPLYFTSTTNSFQFSDPQYDPAYNFYAVSVRSVCSPCGAESYYSDWKQSYTSGGIWHPLNCSFVTNIQTTLTGDTATITWDTLGDASSWEVVVEPFRPNVGIPTAGGVTHTVTSTSYTATGLYPDTKYEVYIRAICEYGYSEYNEERIGGYSDRLCTKANHKYADNIKENFLAFINDILTKVNNGITIDNTYSSPAFDALKPNLTDPNPGIYNFSFSDGILEFSFAPHTNGEIPVRPDVLIKGYDISYGLMTDFNFSSFLSTDFFLDYIEATFENNNSRINIRHVNFCEVENLCKNKDKANDLFKDLLNYLHQKVIDGDEADIVDGYNCPALDALRPYLTDKDALIYKFDSSPFSFSFHNRTIGSPSLSTKDVQLHDWEVTDGNILSIDLDAFVDPESYTVLNDKIVGDDFTLKDAKIKHIDFCAEDPCPDKEKANGLFIELLNHLRDQVLANVTIDPNGYVCDQVIALRPYLTDPEAKVYNFKDNPFSFSFHNPTKEDTESFDVILDQWSLADGTVVSIDISGFQNPADFTSLDAKIILSGGKKISKAAVRHIDYCQDEDPCKDKQIISRLFVKLLNRIQEEYRTNNVVPDGFVCSELEDLNDYLTDENAIGIYNFKPAFSFSFHPIGKNDPPGYDVLIQDWDHTMGTIASIDLVNFTDAGSFTDLDMKVILDNGTKIKTAMVRHIEFCQEENPCPKKEIIANLFVNLLNALRLKSISNNSIIPDGYVCDELQALNAYLTDENAIGIYNFKPNFSFSFHPLVGNEQPNYDVQLAWVTSLGPITMDPIASIDFVNFTDASIFTNLDMKVTLENGYKIEKAQVRHLEFCPDDENIKCIKQNGIELLFVNLVNHLRSKVVNGNMSDIIEGYDCPELAALRPYLTDSNALIHAFASNESAFSFSFHPISGNPKYDVIFRNWDINIPIASIDLTDYSIATDFTQLANKVSLVNGDKISEAEIRHIDFCPDPVVDPEPGNNCATSGEVINYVRDLVNHLKNMVANGNEEQILDTGYDCTALASLRPYLTDSNALIYNFTSNPFSFSFHDIDDPNESPQFDVLIGGWDLNDPESGVENFSLQGYNDPNSLAILSGQITLKDNTKINNDFFIRHVNFCPDEINYCIDSNPRAQLAKQAFTNLINHLRQQAAITTIPDGYTCPQLQDMAAFLGTPNPEIYTFRNNEDEFSFSFSQLLSDATPDVKLSSLIPYGNAAITNINLSNYQSTAFYTSLDNAITFQNGAILPNGQVRRINFCPDDLCVNHIAVVVDESTSLSESEKAKIRFQLKKFVQQQSVVNNAGGANGNMHLSLIGMANSDNGAGNNILQTKITSSNIDQFNNWIDNYGNRYDDSNTDGISEGSDFWNSGLSTALSTSRKPNMVIMITDGCQTENVAALKNTMKGFNNYYGQSAMALPHLYVIGIGEGSYVMGDEPNANKPKNADPNFRPQLRTTETASTPEGNLTSNLKLSLKNLLGYPSSSFPESAVDDFNTTFFSHDDFLLLATDAHYLSDHIKIAGIGCGNISDKDCDNCFSFRPETGKKYILSAWVKEERNIQVENYTNPIITIRCKDGGNVPITNLDCNPTGDIIDGWQRITQIFEIPANTQYVEFELVNQSTELPVFFDDIRIYPVNGSMKSFVYDPENFRLMSELDENNFSTFYEYDQEGGLVRIKKETSEGIKTIQETRSGTYIKE